MSRYLIRRLVQTVFVLFVISILQFTVVRIAPGSPFQLSPENPNLSLADVERLRRQYGLDQPLYFQYLKWLGGLVRGDLGHSYFSQRPVLEIIGEYLPATVELGLAALLVSYLIGIPLGVYAGLHRGGALDHGVRFVTAVLNAVPHWWLSLLILIALAEIYLATGLKLLPLGGTHTPGKEGIDLLDRLWHLVLPALMLGTLGWVTLSRYLRSETLEVLGHEYVRVAYAKGLTSRWVVWRHVLRNVLIPLVTLSSSLFVSLVSGSVIYENIFSWRGMGRLLHEATLRKDYPIIISVTFLYTVLAVFGRLMADLAYSWVDPRIRYE